MTVPVTGAIVMVMGTGLFLFSPKLLYAAMVVSIPFSAMAVLNVGKGDDAKGVAVWLFLAALWFLRETVAVVPPWQRFAWFASRRARYGLLAFLAAVIVSLCVPLLLGGTAWVPDPNPLVNKTVALRFGSFNVTQTVYLGFGVVFSIIAAAENCTSSKLFYTLKLYVGSCIFVAAWGLFQFWCNIAGYTYPAFLFNTNATNSALGYEQTLGPVGVNISRVSSAALEPSVLAEELLIALVVLLVCRSLRKPLLSVWWDNIALMTIVAALLVTTSSTAYVGFLVTLVVAAFSVSRAGRSAKIYLFLVGTIVAAAVLTMVLVPIVGRLATALISDKFQSNSGVWRLHSIEFAARDFLRYPVLGVGWHAVDCKDLVLLILANTGIVGLVAFGFFLLPVWRSLWQQARTERGAAVVLLATLTVTVVLAEVAGLTYSAGYVWLVFGLGAGASVAAGRGRSPAALRARGQSSPGAVGGTAMDVRG